MADDATLKFRTILHWRVWHEWPGVLALATGIALWIFLATGVIAPLADALTRVGGPRPSGAPACLKPPPDEALAGSSGSRPPGCVELPARAPARRG